MRTARSFSIDWSFLHPCTSSQLTRESFVIAQVEMCDHVFASSANDCHRR